jgi:predicted patatin/cPLA2 family phospholipase
LVCFFKTQFLAPRNAAEILWEASLPLTKIQHLDPSTGPKRILALDGGGVRGILTLEYLEVIEALLRQRHNDPDLLLSDYFDLIGGTSTGSIIAAGLAYGMTVKDIKKLYYGLGASVFVPTGLGIVVPKFQVQALQKALDGALGADTTLDSDKIRTGLMIMTKRLDTGSPWPLNNGGRGRYAAQDGALRLTQVVRASTAAPTYFDPERVQISSRDGSVVDGEFVDGGVSPFNDPALQLLMLAALEGHGFHWRTGKNELLLISAGTGTYRSPPQAPGLLDKFAAGQGLRALQSLMDDCARSNQAMLQWLTDCLTPWIIDRAVGDMKLDSQSGPQLATYVRYNVLLEQKWLSSTLNVELSPDKLTQVRKMDKPGNMDELAELGRIAAKEQVQGGHFPAAFNLKP